MSSSATLTTTHLPRLKALLEEWEISQPAPKGFKPLSATDASIRLSSNAVEWKDVIVAFRTRPPLPHEAEDKFKGEIADGDPTATSDVQDPFCSGISVPSAEPGVFVAHVPGMKWSGPTLTHKKYDADLAFGPLIDNEEVYQRIVTDNDIIPLVLSGGIGCILAYGQTGSGKTFTMEGLEHRIARDLFDVANRIGGNLLELEKDESSTAGIQPHKGSDMFEFSVTFLELLGKQASDLVERNTEVDAQGNTIRKALAIQEDKVGDVRPKLISTMVHSSGELEELITTSIAHRRTSATLRNAASSRSHALLTVRIKNRLLPHAEEGQLILVDLAGSERHEDSKAHNKQRMDESRDNNKSLMNLKECVRAKAKMAQEDGFIHVPWRSNKLTMLLKPIFDIESRQPSKTIIIAHVSPHIQDTVHSTNTLSYASPFKTSPPKDRGPAPYDAEDPRTWNHAQTHAWLTQQVAKTKGKLCVDVDKVCPSGVTAFHLGKLYTTEWVQKCLQARIEQESTSTGIDDLKDAAMGVIGDLYYSILTAKTRKRNAVMKSRRAIAVDTYGQAPIRYVPGTDRIYEPYEIDPIEYIEAREAIGLKWDEEVQKAVQKAKSEGLDLRECIDVVQRDMMDAWRAGREDKEIGEVSETDYQKEK